MKKRFALLLAVILLTLSACTGTNNSAQTDTPNTDTPAQTDAPNADTEVQYDYQLKAGEMTEVYDVVFEKMVTVTVDPASTRNAANELRSNIVFDNCVFNGGLTVIGDFHAMVRLGGGCSFGDGSVVTCKEVTSGAAKEATMDDNFVKIFVGCEGVTVETESAVGVVIENSEVVFNGTTYSKSKLAPDADYVGIYSLYENDSMAYVKLALGEDDSVEFLD